MKKLIIIILINIFALFMVSNIVHGITIEKWETLIVSAVVLSFINIFLKPIIKFITLPINILSLGIFTLFINAFLLYFLEKLVKGFYIANFGSAFIGALLLSLIYMLIETFVIRTKVRIFRKEDIYTQRTQNKESIPEGTVIDVEAVDEKNK
ncbi:MAG: phage holin family protein [Endomicrobiaceae bacterium]|nr:phage holin family protein [Endomicrobiaceae bacterium]